MEMQVGIDAAHYPSCIRNSERPCIRCHEEQRQVLQATVRRYVDTTKPAGSETLVKRF